VHTHVHINMHEGTAVVLWFTERAFSVSVFTNYRAGARLAGSFELGLADAPAGDIKYGN